MTRDERWKSQLSIAPNLAARPRIAAGALSLEPAGQGRGTGQGATQLWFLVSGA